MEQNLVKKKKLHRIRPYIGIGVLTILSFGLTSFCIFVSKNADVPIQIKTIDEFKNIVNTGMDKHYMITGYLTFKDWEPLGDEEHPFTGVLESKHPISIKSFSSANNKKNVGLFSVNKGVIKGIKIYNPSLNDNLDDINSFGYFAGINRGEITNCNVYMGSTTITVNSENAVVGTLCGINYGKVTKCITTNQMIVNNPNKNIDFGHICGKSLSGNIELCTGKSSATISAKNVNGGGICGTASDTKFDNDFASNRVIVISSSGSLKIGGFIGSIGEKPCQVTNSFNRANINNISGSDTLKFGSVGYDSNQTTTISNCVSALSITTIPENREYGIFLTYDNADRNVNNCYYVTASSLAKYKQGQQKKYSDLSLSLLKWDSSVWKITSSGIECVIDYDK